VILFLNKKDLLEEKIMHSHLVDYFPEFDGLLNKISFLKNSFDLFFKVPNVMPKLHANLF
jgi:hypothetical protein